MAQVRRNNGTHLTGAGMLVVVVVLLFSILAIIFLRNTTPTAIGGSDVRGPIAAVPDVEPISAVSYPFEETPSKFIEVINGIGHTSDEVNLHDVITAQSTVGPRIDPEHLIRNPDLHLVGKHGIQTARCIYAAVRLKAFQRVYTGPDHKYGTYGNRPAFAYVIDLGYLFRYLEQLNLSDLCSRKTMEPILDNHFGKGGWSLENADSDVSVWLIYVVGVSVSEKLFTVTGYPYMGDIKYQMCRWDLTMQVFPIVNGSYSDITGRCPPGSKGSAFSRPRW